jgi:hypothetical protein
LASATLIAASLLILPQRHEEHRSATLGEMQLAGWISLDQSPDI